MTNRALLFLATLFLLCSIIATGAAYAQTQPIPDSSQATAPADTARKKLDQEKIMQGLKEYSRRKGPLARLVRSVVHFNPREEPVGRDAALLSRLYDEHNYKIVRNIEIRNLNSFGYSINDSTAVPDNFLEKAGNAIHIKTGRGRIRNKLLFRKGEELEPFDIAESERLLRQTGYIYDARITVNEATTTQDSVDLIVVTRDVFSIGVGAALNTNTGYGIIKFRDINFLGQGHQFQNQYSFNNSPIVLGPRPVQTWRYQGSYVIENIYKTYLTGELHYLNEYNRLRYGVRIGRDFFALNTKYAGGAGLDWADELGYQDLNDTVREFFNLQYTVRDVWFGRSFALRSYNLGYDTRGRLIAAGRIINTNYTQKPENYSNGNFYLAGFGYSFRKYYKDRYLFGFGRTEDIPAGTLFTATAGLERNEVRTRPYVGVRGSYGTYRSNTGYFFADVEFGSFINRQKDKWEQGLLSTEVFYFTKLYSFGTWRWRQFISNRITYGINRFSGEYIDVNKNQGLRGFSSGTLRGSSRFVINYESNLFTPLTFLGFRLAIIAFADLAWIQVDDSKSLLKQGPYQALGIGFRMRNEFLAFSTIQFFVGFYPRIPEGETMRNIKFYESSRPFYDFSDFRYTQPGPPLFR